jgi:hypothetical protein
MTEEKQVILSKLVLISSGAIIGIFLFFVIMTVAGFAIVVYLVP